MKQASAELSRQIGQLMKGPGETGSEDLGEAGWGRGHQGQEQGS